MAETTQTKSLRVAVAIDEDELGLERFGHATRFAVYELSGGEPRFVERRDSIAACGSGPGWHQDRLERAAAVIGDCRAVAVKEIGPGAVAVLRRRGLSVHIGSGTVAGALQALLVGADEATLLQPGGPA
jgi:predicted Fe-Mo cluster-binding NifX family protein